MQGSDETFVSLNSILGPFECDIKPRSLESEKRVREALLDDEPHVHGFVN